MGKVRQSQLASGRGINDRKYKAEGNYQHVKPKWEEDRKTRKFVFHPKTEAQQQSLHSFEDNMVTINYGSVASGKTAISCWWLANQYLEGKIKKIYIGRPNTTLDNRENGFRSGNILEKCYASLLPQIQYLSDVLGRNVVDMQLEKKDGFIELLDIEYLRGMDFGHNIGIHFDDTQKIATRARFNESLNIRFVQECYEGFLTEQEIYDVTHNSKELYLDEFEIRNRLAQREQKRAEESQEQATEFLMEIEDTQFDYSELPLEELEEELQMYNEDIKKLRKAIADKKKELSVNSKPTPSIKKVGVEKLLAKEYEKLKAKKEVK